MKLFAKRNTCFGLDFSDTTIKVAELEGQEGDVRLKSIGRYTIPDGIIVDGNIKEPEELASLIKIACQRAKPRPILAKYVVYSLPETKGFIRVMKVPSLAGEALREAVFKEAQQVFPLNLEEAYVDWSVLGTGADGSLEVIVAAVPERLVDEYSAVMRLAGLVPVSAEIESVAIVRSLIHKHNAERPVMIIDLGRDRTGFIICKDLTIQFTATIPVSGKEMNKAIAKRFNISEARAEELKLQCGYRNEGECIEVYKVMDENLQEMIEYMGKLLGYYGDRHKNEEEIGKVVICGGEAKLEGLLSLLSFHIKREVERGDPWVNILNAKRKELPPLSRQESLVFVTVLGLALRGLEENKKI